MAATEAQKRAAKAWQQRQKKAGKCRRCGGKRTKAGTANYCADCRTIDRLSSAKRYERKKLQNRQESSCKVE